MLKIDNLSKYYKVDKDEFAVAALNEVSLDLPAQGLVMIVGTSGCGKTTLLNILGGIDKPTSGSVEIGGQKLDYSSNVALEYHRAQNVSFVFQDYNLMYEYSVIDNIKLGMQIQRMDKEEVQTRADKALQDVGLGASFAKRKITALSGGQQQRVALARAIAKDCKYILCDEPTGNLDATNSNEIFALLKQLSNKHLIIVVTHDDEMAEKYGDRIIRLADGKVVDDTTKQTASVNDNISQTKDHKSNKLHKSGGLSVGKMFLMIKDNIVKSLLSNITMLVALIATFTLVASFFSLQLYSSRSAFINTTIANNQYVFQVTKYIDQRLEIPIEDDTQTGNGGIASLADTTTTGSVSYQYGPQLYYDQATIDDMQQLQQKYSGKANFYPSYFFNKNLQDFDSTGTVKLSMDRRFQYEAEGFRDIVVVDDFSTFHMQLLYGSLPQKGDDDGIVIYDYMANSMIKRGLFSGTIESLVGKTLTDVDTKLTMTIVGILKSNYEQYSYVTDGNGDYTFEETYLSGLQTVFCTPELFEKVQSESQFYSIYQITVSTSAETDAQPLENYKKLQYVHKENFANLDIIAKIEDTYTTEEQGSSTMENSRGVLLSVSQVAQILGVDRNTVNKDTAVQFMKDYTAKVSQSLYDYSNERSYIYSGAYTVIGVYDDASATTNLDIANNTMLYYTHSQDDLTMLNAQFRQIYLSLGTNWQTNAEVLNDFWVEAYSQSYYESLPDDYKIEGYASFSPYNVLITNAESYMLQVRTFSSYIMYILLVLAAVFIVIYTYINIKRYDYKIGVLKALGASKWNILLVFGLQMILISLLAFVISLPIAVGVLSRINMSFVSSINASMVFFSLNGLSVLITMLIAVVGVAVVAIGPLLRMCFASPISVINNSRDQ